MLKFYWECLKKTKPAYNIARHIAFILGVIVSPLGMLLYEHVNKEPMPGGIISGLIWQIPLGTLVILSIMQFIMSPYWMYKELQDKYSNELKELKDKSIKEVYDAFPETKKGIVFRELFKLYNWGEQEQKTCEERQRKWDDAVIITLNKHFSEQCKINYLLGTGRRVVDLNNISPLKINKFDDALYYIKDLLERMFDTYYKS